MAAAIMGIVALSGSWWAPGMTMEICALDGSGAGPRTIGEVLLAITAEIFALIFPLDAWYFCVRIAKTVLRKDQPGSMDQLQA